MHASAERSLLSQRGCACAEKWNLKVPFHPNSLHRFREGRGLIDVDGSGRSPVAAILVGSCKSLESNRETVGGDMRPRVLHVALKNEHLKVLRGADLSLHCAIQGESASTEIVWLRKHSWPWVMGAQPSCIRAFTRAAHATSLQFIPMHGSTGMFTEIFWRSLQPANRTAAARLREREHGAA